MADEIIQVTVDPGKDFTNAINRALKQTGNLTTPLKLMARQWYKGNRSIFDVNRKSKGRYKDLSEKPFTVYWEAPESGLNDFYEGGYKEFKERKFGFVYPILRATGHLAASMTVPNHPNSVNYIINKSILVLGTNVTSKKGAPYGIWLQTGTKKMPARPYVLIGGEQTATPEINKRREVWLETLHDWVMQVSKKNLGNK